MSECVVIIGGGVAGLTAAHELIKRGFDVHVYERRPILGGKAASTRVPSTTPQGAGPGLPGEHGFRFFPGWYRHLTATMADIPYRRRTTLYQGTTVADNLVTVQTNRLAWSSRAPIDLPLQMPRTPTEAVTAAQFVAAFGDLGLTAVEVTLFFRKLLEVAAMSEAARIDKLEQLSWWDFLECDAPSRSQAYRDFVRATTRTMVAAKAEEASAYTIGRIAVRTFLDTMTSVDRVLCGPTNEMWIDPWVEHLEALGVVFHRGVELESMEFDQDEKRIEKLRVVPVVLADVRRLRVKLERFAKQPEQMDDATFSELIGQMAELASPDRFVGIAGDEAGAKLVPLLRAGAVRMQPLQPELQEARRKLRELEDQLAKARGPRERAVREQLAPKEEVLQSALEGVNGRLRQEFDQLGELSDALAQVEAVGRQTAPFANAIDADYFVLALPLEQLAYYVNRSPMLTFLAPKLRDVLRLSLHMDWMSGIQFYLNCHVSLSPGHLVGMDSPWALTAIESTQFWRDVTLPKDVRSVVSVDISAWNQLGNRIRKEAYNCTDDEIAQEVWHQLEQMLNRKERPDVLRPTMLVGGALVRNQSYHLDESVVDLRDRKKQASYERARGVKFSTLDLVSQEEAEGDGQGDTQHDDPFMWGPRWRFNAEPLLINRPGSHQLRPGARTELDNLFLAGDFVKTQTDLATMEGANEAARLAVNELLRVAGSREEPCELFPFSPARQALGAVMTLGGTLRGLEGAWKNATDVQRRFWKPFALGMLRDKNDRSVR